MRQPLITMSFQFTSSHRVTLTLQEFCTLEENKVEFPQKQRSPFQFWNFQCFIHYPKAHTPIPVFTSPALYVKTCVQTSKIQDVHHQIIGTKYFFLQLVQSPNLKSSFLAISNQSLHQGNTSRMCYAMESLSWCQGCHPKHPSCQPRGLEWHPVGAGRAGCPTWAIKTSSLLPGGR